MGKSIYGCLCFLKRSEKTDTEVEYDGYFCSITDAVIIVTLVHSWATTETVSKFLAQAFGIEMIISGHKMKIFKKYEYGTKTCIEPCQNL